MQNMPDVVNQQATPHGSCQPSSEGAQPKSRTFETPGQSQEEGGEEKEPAEPMQTSTCTPIDARRALDGMDCARQSSGKSYGDPRRTTSRCAPYHRLIMDAEFVVHDAEPRYH